MTAASLRPKSFFTLRSLLRRPSVSRAEIEAFQCSRLRRLVSHAYEKVPYYRRLLDRQGLKPQDIRSLADLAAIPVTSRKDLQSLPAAEVCAAGLEPARLVVRPTSGSTGEPVRLRRTWFEERLLSVYRQRAFRDFGLRATDLRVRIAERIGLLQKRVDEGGLPVVNVGDYGNVADIVAGIWHNGRMIPQRDTAVKPG